MSWIVSGTNLDGSTKTCLLLVSNSSEYLAEKKKKLLPPLVFGMWWLEILWLSWKLKEHIYGYIMIYMDTKIRNINSNMPDHMFYHLFQLPSVCHGTQAFVAYMLTISILVFFSFRYGARKKEKLPHDCEFRTLRSTHEFQDGQFGWQEHGRCFSLLLPGLAAERSRMKSWMQVWYLVDTHSF